MILRPVSPPPSSLGTIAVPAWDAVLSTQRQHADRYLLIAQDDHARLAGDLAAVMNFPGAPRLDPDLVDAIRRHDCGWRTLDRQLLARARSGAHPLSFVDMTVPEFLAAWTESIEQVAGATPLGGAAVSLHFSRLAEYRIRMRQDEPGQADRLEAFLRSEAQRRRHLTSSDDACLAPLTDVLQLCDLISLFLCCGAEATGLFALSGGKLQLQRQNENFRFSPAVLRSPVDLVVPATPWPDREEAAELHFRIE